MEICEGFAHGNVTALTGYWVTNNLSSLVATVLHEDIAGHSSGYRALMTAATTTLTRVFAATDRYLHIAYNTANVAHSGQTIVGFVRSGSSQLTIEILADGRVVIKRGATVMVTSVVTVTNNVWHWFWIDLVADPVVGRCRVYLDGNATAIADTGAGVNTADSGLVGWDQLAFVAAAATNGTFTDIVSYSAAEYTALFGTSLPELFIPGIRATSDETNTFVSGGFADVDEVPWSTADVAGANAVGQELIMAHGGLAWTPPGVYGVANTWLMERDGVVTAMQSRLKSGAANVTSTAVASIGAGQSTERQTCYAQNPDGTVNWDWAAVLASKFGVKTS